LSAKCPECGSAIPDNARFCPGCSIPQTYWAARTTNEIFKGENTKDIEKPPKWPRDSTFIIISIFTVLIIIWVIFVLFGGEKIFFGPEQSVFSGISADEGDTIKIVVISGDVPITVYATSQTNSRITPLKYLDEMEFKLGPHERQVVEFKALNNDKWGVVVVAPNFERAYYRIQLLEPAAPGHIRYTWVPLIPIVSSFSILMMLDYALYYMKKNILFS